MICIHCNKNLPEGLTACFHCGLPQRKIVVPVQTPIQPGIFSPPVQEAVRLQPTGGKKKGTAAIIAAVVAVLLLGGTVGGHFMGFYELPFLPERPITSQNAALSLSKRPETTTPDISIITPLDVPDVAQHDTPNMAEQPADGTLQTDSEVLNAFQFANLYIQTNTTEGARLINPGSYGMMELSFTLLGDISDVAAMYILGWRQSEWTSDDIVSNVNNLIPSWKENGAVLGSIPDGKVYGSFPIFEHDLGQIVNVLLIALDVDWEPLGHIIMPVTIPMVSEPSTTSQDLDAILNNMIMRDRDDYSYSHPFAMSVVNKIRHEDGFGLEGDFGGWTIVIEIENIESRGFTITFGVSYLENGIDVGGQMIGYSEYFGEGQKRQFEFELGDYSIAPSNGLVIEFWDVIVE